MERLIDVDTIIHTIKEDLNSRIDSQVDKKWIEENLNSALERLKKKREERKLDLSDLRDLLRIYKNVVIPAAKKEVVEKLNSIKSLSKASKNGSMGIS